MQTIHELIEQLHSSLKEYIEATYHISDATLISRRKKLLDAKGVIHQEPYLESTPRYQSGSPFASMAGLSKGALDAYTTLSSPDGPLPRIIYDPPYRHQSEAIQHCLIEGKNLIIMTGTGSGKTESFLLPILGKLAREASESPRSFAEQAAMRALILYPMNALVNDQLGRLRNLFGDPRIVKLFKSWTGRPPHFARYTSRTPYAGLRTAAKDSVKLKSVEEFYADIENTAHDKTLQGHDEARGLIQTLKGRGKWPAKPSLSSWFGAKGSRWQNVNDDFVRAVTLPDDSELLTRHEVQTAPPDLLVTNYSMLEYMLMRPIERSIFDKTHSWLESNPSEKFWVVLDEAHLYRGSAGSEVALLLRRLRTRLGIPPERFQVICATASFKDHLYAPQFGAQLSGVSAESFVAITGSLNLKEKSNAGSMGDVDILSSINMDNYYKASNEEEKFNIIGEFLKYRSIEKSGTAEFSLYKALLDYGPMGKLVNLTMTQAVPISDLGQEIFPAIDKNKADIAVTTLMSLGSVARPEPSAPGLLPCRIHNFFRGLPGLWVCLDPECSDTEEENKSSICGKMYSQPRERCICGARVLELYTCRHCGTAYARAYTDDVDTPSTLWAEAGQRLRMEGEDTVPLLPIDLLLEQPTNEEVVELADYDLEAGCLNPRILSSRRRKVFIPVNRHPKTDEDGNPIHVESRGQFIPCAICRKDANFGKSSVQNHQTKGDQPFLALVTRQLQIQPPTPVEDIHFAPLQGRKVLAFSDSRQVAARLAPNLQMYSVRNSLRPLIAWGYRKLQSIFVLAPNLCLDHLYLSVLLASKELNVRLRPEMKPGESFDAELIVEAALKEGKTDNESDLLQLCLSFQGERPPEALLESIITTISDRFLGFEALALASIAERNKHTETLKRLPPIPGYAESDEAKIGLVRAWLRCWRYDGFWLNSMPSVWWRRNRSEGVRVAGNKNGEFKKAMDIILQDKNSRKVFKEKWLPELLRIFTEDTGGLRRLRGGELSLFFDGEWNHCSNCKSVHRPIPGLALCLDCGSPRIRMIDPNTDPVFLARKGFYRKPVIEALSVPPRPPLALVAAEHTAQLNSPQNEDIFSKAEQNELLFQDINLGKWGDKSTAIDVLSSTTTMEVGLDIGALSGVALRNMPPGRANYQQRSGRAGRRGNTAATVVAFGSADSHDEHYFTAPDEMIRGDVIDPKLTLDNIEIVRRHIRAFLLQNYHQAKIPENISSQNSDLFSVLGTVADFRKKDSILNRNDFASWLLENIDGLKQDIASWIPVELGIQDREILLNQFIDDCLGAIDEAIKPDGDEIKKEQHAHDENDSEEILEVGNERPHQASRPANLLDRLLYCGKLPRYAFPTDVATFHVFDRERSTPFRPLLRFSPQQGLPIALTQYAPGKQVWIAGKCYTSGAIYSVMLQDRYKAWEDKRIYMECSTCGFAKTFPIGKAERNEKRNCDACGGQETFGPGRYWFRPTGFAHPIDVMEVTSPDEIPETSYATRAKLTMATPADEAGWITVNERIRIMPSRQHLLVSNSGPKNEGYTYCLKCGRIEADTEPSPRLIGPHMRPYPCEEKDSLCEGSIPAKHIVLGTDFITDIALLSLRVSEPVLLKPGYYSTIVALRTISEALAKAACQILEVETGELLAEFRPALTQNGVKGLEAEVFLYDSLPGGAGFASQLPDYGMELFEVARKIIKQCPENCDSSCYRCLRSFKNKFEHSFLDRHVGTELIDYLLDGMLPPQGSVRIESSTQLLLNDLQRQNISGVNFEGNGKIVLDGVTIAAPILAKHIQSSEQTIITLSRALSNDFPEDPVLASLRQKGCTIPIITQNELIVRTNLPAATQDVLGKMHIK